MMGESQVELWDLFDRDRKPLGKTHQRNIPMEPGTYHIVAEIWTVNSQGQILLTQRSPEKEAFPNEWECTGGSVLAGETALQGAVRELKEETGIVAAEEELTYITTYMESRAFVDSFFLHKDVEDLVMQPGETVAAQWVSLEKMEQLIAEGQIAMPVARRFEAMDNKFNQLWTEAVHR